MNECDELNETIFTGACLCCLGIAILLSSHFHIASLSDMVQNAALAIRSCGNPCTVV